MRLWTGIARTLRQALAAGRRAGGFAWRWSPIATLPVSILFLQWASATWRGFRSFALEYDSTPVVVTLRDVGTDEWNNLARRTRLLLSGRTLADIPPDRALGTVQLFVDGRGIAKLNSDLPYSGYEFGKGQLMFADGLHPVRVRYRGDFLVHWAYDKKSIRVKTETDELFLGMRAFNLIVPKFPEQLNNYLGYKLAEIMGIIGPRCELVNVMINGRNQGLHEFTEQLEEGTLRRWDRMPGDLYSGDLISKSQVQGTTSRVFEMPESWEKIAFNNHYDADSREPLQQLLRLLNGSPGEQTETALSRLLDMRAWGAFGAYELLTQTHHFDEYHNWRLFWDPWALKFSPVVWDPIAWAPEMRPANDDRVPLDMVVSRLHIWLHRNGDFLAARNAALHAFFEQGQVERFRHEVAWAMSAAREALALDPNVRPTDPAAVADGMERFGRFIDKVLHEIRAAHVDALGQVLYTAPDANGAMAFEVAGRQPVDAVELEFRDPIDRAIGASLRVRRGEDHPAVDLSGGVAVGGATVRVPARMFSQLEPRYLYLPNQVLRQRSLEDVPSYYELLLTGLPTDNPLRRVTAIRAGRSERAEERPALPPRDLWWLYRSTVPQPQRRAQVWSGDLTIADVREVTDDVVIQPGTTLRLGPGATLLFRGRVTAVGTEEQPIRVVPVKDGQEPWGTVAINGPDCSGSTFRFCKLRGGSGHKTPLEEYCAMFSVHNCRDVRVEDCRFADNQVVDDMVHVVYAEVLFDRVELIGARADGLDCDISSVVVRRSRFANCGNDGIDLMTTRALVHDCRFQGNGDKGISIGEGSSVIAVRDGFDGCDKAMEAKDGSVARAVNCEIRNCKRALNAYRKNWRYDAGGRLTVEKSVFAGNREMPTADASSQIALVDCQLDQPVAPRFHDGRREIPNRTSQKYCSRGPAPTLKRPLPFPSELPALEAMAGPVWASARNDLRGGVQ